MSNANGNNNNRHKGKDLKVLFCQYCSIPEQKKNEISEVSTW